MGQLVTLAAEPCPHTADVRAEGLSYMEWRCGDEKRRRVRAPSRVPSRVRSDGRGGSGLGGADGHAPGDLAAAGVVVFRERWMFAAR